MGSPNAKGVLHRSKYENYFDFALKVIELGIGSQHPGVLKAIDKIAKWQSGEIFCICSDVFKAQKSKGVEPKEILAEIIAVFLYFRIHQTSGDGLPSLRFQIGVSVTRFKRCSDRKVSYLEKKHLGSNLLDAFLPLMKNVYGFLKKEINEKRREVEMYSAPIVEQVQ